MKTVGVYIPRYLYTSDPSDRFFIDELTRCINASTEYRAKRIHLETLRLANSTEAKAFCDTHSLVAFVQHDSSLYSRNAKYQKTMELLAEHIVLFNSLNAQEIGSDKITTKRLLRSKDIPVLDDAVIDTKEALMCHMAENSLYVVKPSDKGAGSGVKLIKRQQSMLFQYVAGEWKTLRITEGRGNGVAQLTLKRMPNRVLLSISVLLLVLAMLIPFGIFALFPLSLALVMVAIYLFVKTHDRGYTYRPLLIEPYFNNTETEFESVRCTVIGDRVVEAVSRVNMKNITSNVSSGGKARALILTKSQEEIAVAASVAIGADYSGVDLLVKGDESVIGEVNIGPFTLFCKTTGVNVGRLFAEYLICHLEKARNPIPLRTS